jgi:hypothetical protein
MNGQHGKGWQRKVAWAFQVLGVLVAVSNVRVPPANLPLGVIVANQFDGNGNNAPDRVRAVLAEMRDWDRAILNGNGPFDPSAATGITVAALMAFGLLWVSRWFDGKDGPKTVERILTAAAPPALVGLALASPSTALIMAGAQVVFEYCYPPQRDVYVIGVAPNGVAVVQKV